MAETFTNAIGMNQKSKSSKQMKLSYQQHRQILRAIYKTPHSLSDISLGSYMAKDEPRTFPVDNHIPFDGRGMSKAYLSNGTPMKLFFD